MSSTVEEKYDAGTGPDDFLVADDPPEDVTAGQDEAPYGWTKDRQTGELRPKKRPGRPAVPPGPEDLADAEPLPRDQDRPPDAKKPPKDKTGDPAMPRGGVIAAGVNKLYRRAGKIIRAMDPDLGTAVIACTRKDDEEPDELTVGEAWENLCRTNPRIRRFVMQAIAGGAVGDLVMAHAPIGVALLMKPWVQRLIPFGRLVESAAEPDEDTPEGEGGLPGGMTEADFEDMKATAEQQARRMAHRMGMAVSDAQMAEAVANAEQRMPPAFRSQGAQPRRQSRAKRRG